PTELTLLPYTTLFRSITNYDVDNVDAGVRTAGFIALATFIRPLGGFIGDGFNPLIALIYTFLGITIGGIILAFSPTFLLFSIGRSEEHTSEFQSRFDL